MLSSKISIKSFFIFLFLLSSTPVMASDIYRDKTELFQKLSNAGIDQVVELPYNKSLLANIGRQVKIHNIDKMQYKPDHLPKPKSLKEEFNQAFEYEADRNVIPSLTYRIGEGDCEYMEAVKISETLVCYRKAHQNSSMLAPVQNYNQSRCTTQLTDLSHCYIFAHSVDDVIRAISN